MALTIKDKAKFINEGPFWEKHPDVYPDVVRYTARDEHDNLLEAWERADDGLMVDVTDREKAYEELERAQDALAKFFDEEDE